jgi:hypothetical protein
MKCRVGKTCRCTNNKRFSTEQFRQVLEQRQRVDEGEQQMKIYPWGKLPACRF